MLKLLRYLKNYKLQCVLGPLFKLTEAIFELITPLVMARIIDVGIKNRDKDYVFKMGGIMVALGVTGLTVALIAQYFAAQASQGFGTVVRNEMFSHIQKLSHTEVEKLGTPSLITRLTNDINQLQIGVAMTIRQFLRAPFLVIGATIMSFTINVKLACIFVIATPLIALVIYLIMSYSIPFYKKNQKILDKISLITRENLTGVRVIRAFSKQKHETKRFEKTTIEYKNNQIKVAKISSLLNPVTYLIMNIAIILILWFGGKNVNIGDLSQGEVIALVNYMMQILFALIMLANLIVIFMKTFAAATRVNEVFETQSTICEVEKDNTNLTSKVKVEFQNVSYLYHDASEPALNKISFSIGQNQIVGIIGGTGSGKTTLMNLILRFYDVTDGRILVDGVNVRDYSLKNLRDKIGYVPQKAVLLSGTIRDNLKFGCSNATDEEIYKALEIAQAKEFVDNFSEGLNKNIAQQGKNLSGGQRQRLTIARALVSKPEILILDDSSSALDYATDAALRKSLNENLSDTTVIIVSQRTNSIKHCDQIIVLDDGEIVGNGKHNELLENCNIYREICLSQESNK